MYLNPIKRIDLSKELSPQEEERLKVRRVKVDRPSDVPLGHDVVLGKGYGWFYYKYLWEI